MAASGQKQKVFHLLIREAQDEAGEYQLKDCAGYFRIGSGREVQEMALKECYNPEDEDIT